MSFSDYIQLKKIKETKNIYPYFNSASYAQHKKLCAVLDTQEVDIYGDVVPHKLGDIPITDNMNNCTPNTYTGQTTTPVMFAPPRSTTFNPKANKHPKF
jgi:hypothetical protein